MDEFLEQIEQAYTSGNFYLALFCCLTLPDICGAISSTDGTATGKKFKAWFDKYVAPLYGGNFSGSNCYGFRCAALHQGRSDHKDLKPYVRILFLAPVHNQKSKLMHNNVMNDALNLDVSEFCKDVISGVRHWLQDEALNLGVQKNLDAFLKRHKDGFEPFIVGVEVFS